MLRPTLFAALLVGAFWVDQVLIYQPIIVPALGGVVAVPLTWWLASFSPELLVCAIATWVFRSIPEGAAFCVMGGLAVTTAQFTAGISNWPGHLKFVEGGLLHFAVRFGLLSTLLAVVVLVLAIARYGIQRVRAG